MIFKKLLRIFFSIILGLFALYLFLALAIIPLFSPILIKTYGSKFLKTPVGVRGVYVNPLYLSLHIIGLDIKNNANEEVLGLNRLRLDISFRGFFKKIIHVEAAELDGLFVHASVLENGTVDIVNILSAPGAASAFASASPAQPLPEKKNLPLIVIDKIILHDGTFQLEDRTVSPPFTTMLYQTELTVTGFSTRPDSLTNVEFKTFIDGKSTLTAHALVKPMQEPLDLEFSMELAQYSLTATSPYVAKYTGRNLAEGKMNFNTTYRISNNKLTAKHNVLIQYFNFGDKVESKDALNLPFGLAVALLEDSQGRIRISLPVDGDLNDPQFQFTHVLWQTTRNFFTKLVTKPFSVLGSMLSLDGASGGNEELGSIHFLPGKAELAPEEEKKLVILAQAMKDRPRLLLEINGSYDLTSDWKNLKADQFHNDYSAMKKESSKDENKVLQTLYQRRYGIRQLWKLSKAFKTPGGYRYEDMNTEIRRHLGEDAFPNKKALDALAKARAKIAYDIILKEHLDPRRVSVGKNHEVQGSSGLVPMEFTLTVFEE